MTKHSETLSTKTLLMVGALKDETVPVEEHFAPLVRSLEERKARLMNVHYDTGHNMIDKRMALTRLVIGWLREKVWVS